MGFNIMLKRRRMAAIVKYKFHCFYRVSITLPSFKEFTKFNCFNQVTQYLPSVLSVRYSTETLT